MSSRLITAIRLSVFLLATCFAFMGLLTTLPVILITAGTLTFIYFGILHPLVNSATTLIYNRDRGYHQYRKLGGDPFLDSLPYPLNPDSDRNFYVLPFEEPDYNTYVPPTWWQFQCLSCKSRVESATGMCWNCGKDLTA